MAFSRASHPDVSLLLALSLSLCLVCTLCHMGASSCSGLLDVDSFSTQDMKPFMFVVVYVLFELLDWFDIVVLLMLPQSLSLGLDVSITGLCRLEKNPGFPDHPLLVDFQALWLYLAFRIVPFPFMTSPHSPQIHPMSKPHIFQGCKLM